MGLNKKVVVVIGKIFQVQLCQVAIKFAHFFVRSLQVLTRNIGAIFSAKTLDKFSVFHFEMIHERTNRNKFLTCLYKTGGSAINASLFMIFQFVFLFQYSTSKVGEIARPGQSEIKQFVKYS